MKFEVVSLFPNLISAYLQEGILSRALREKQIELNIINPREFSLDIHHTVDDKSYGGGDGMLMLAENIAQSIDLAKTRGSQRCIYLSPQGKVLNQNKITELMGYKHLTFICGRYAGIDDRVIRAAVDEELSIGDFVLNGGELAALVCIESISRLIPGVLGNRESGLADSLISGILEAPQFTRPGEWRGLKVPEILRSGDHSKIQYEKFMMSLLVTWKKRPDLMAQYWSIHSTPSKVELKEYWSELTSEEKANWGVETLTWQAPQLAVGLFHYPILDREKRIVASNITNFDVHDIARAARVYGVENYFIVHPNQEQLMFVERILDHWRVGTGSKFNPKRKTALTNVRTAATLEHALRSWGVKNPLIIATHARAVGVARTYSFKELRYELFQKKRPVFLILGTGFGLTDEFMSQCSGVLESIRGAPPDDYRHLSVRSAASICLDRLLGPW